MYNKQSGINPHSFYERKSTNVDDLTQPEMKKGQFVAAPQQNTKHKESTHVYSR